jgi:hypothetical protein
MNFHCLGNFTACKVHWVMYWVGVNVFVLYVHSVCITLECFYMIKLVPTLFNCICSCSIMDLPVPHCLLWGQRASPFHTLDMVQGEWTPALPAALSTSVTRCTDRQRYPLRWAPALITVLNTNVTHRAKCIVTVELLLKISEEKENQWVLLS